MLSALSSRARDRLAICLLRSEINVTFMLLKARLASGSAASCSSSRVAMTLPTPSPQRRGGPLRSPTASASSRLSFAAAPLPPPTCLSSYLLARMLRSFSGSYKKSPGVRTRLAAGAASRGKTDVDASPTTGDTAAVSSSQPSPPPPPAAPRRTVEQIVKRITRGADFSRSCSSPCRTPR